jgi:hypothetical protein
MLKLLATPQPSIKKKPMNSPSKPLSFWESVDRWILRIGYSAMLSMHSNGLRIARGTGRDPKNIQQIEKEVEDYKKLLTLMDAEDRSTFGPE